jgi:hypothetical protein
MWRVYKRFLLGLSLLIGVNSMAAATGSEQIYFVAKVAPVGSLSSPGQQQIGVYLRWDVVEGSLPTDLARFQLERNNQQLLDVSANEMMSEAQIIELYQGPTQQRRLLESLAWLQEQAASEQPSVQITTANFAQQIRQRAQSNPLWSALASRVDFNIARARYRGYLDLESSSGTNTYELYGVNQSDYRVLLGRAVVNTAVTTQVFAPVGFQQVRQSQCDAPEAAKDHGAVALTWDHGGDNDTDRFANSLLITGYDLYRDIHPPQGTPTTRHIAQLAANASHDQTGTPRIDGMERVNQQPIMISGRPDGESAAHFVQALETAKDTAAAGLKPGDRRMYHLVPRDFTGNYGPTVSALITIPDLRPPPAPWSVEVETHDASNRFNLVWDAVNLINYHRSHDDGRQFCNLDSARAENALRYVPRGKVCGIDTEIEIRLDVDSYRVYRFDTYQAAAAFKDSDGDGYSDREERPAGTQCRADLGPPAGGTNALLPSNGFSTRQLPDGRQQIVFTDPYPAENKSEVVWYRIASVNGSGLGSTLTSPIRGHFPDRQLPAPPEFGKDITLTTTIPGTCDYTVEQREKSTEGPMFLDTTGDARSIHLVCRSSAGGFRGSFPLKAGPGGLGFTPSESQCQALLEGCGYDGGESGHALLYFLDGSGSELNQFSGSVSPSMLLSCPQINGQRLLTSKKPCGQSRAVTAGELLNQPPQLTVSTNQCIAIYREIGGKDYKIDTACNGNNVVVDYGPSDASQGDMVCLSAATQNENARSSARTRLPCFSVVMPNHAPAAPQPMELVFHDDQAQIIWQLPEERVTATVLEVYQQGESAKHIKTIPHPGARGGEPRKGAVDITAALPGHDWQQEWCVRVRAIGQAASGDQAGALSEWSAPLCALRLPVGQQAGQYLPWPEIPRPPTGTALESFYLGFDQIPILRVSQSIKFPESCDINTYELCDLDDADSGSCLAKAPSSLTCYRSPSMNTADPICGPIRDATAGHLGFVAYRQSRPLGGGVADDFVQISPLIDGMFCSNRIDPKGETSIHGTFEDPYLKLLQFSTNHKVPDLGMVFVDRYPHLPGREYRYQFVYFSADGEIIETRSSQDWLAVPQ